jgi:HK97 family phage major capsid protein
VEDRQSAYHAAKAKMDEAAAEGRSLSAEEREFVDRTFAELDEKRTTIDTLLDAEKREREIAESMRGLEDVARPVESREAATSDVDVLRSILSGERRSHTFEVRDLSKATSNAPVPTSFSDQVIARARLVGPMLDPSIVTFLTTAGGEDLVLPSQSAWSTALIKAEGSQIAESDPLFGKTTLKAYKYSTMIQVTSEFINDSNIDVLGFLAQQLGDAFGYNINADLTTGDGSSKPTGVVHAAGTGVTGVGTAVSSLGTGAFRADDVIDLIYSLDGAARRLPGFGVMANGNGIAALRKLKDSEGAYLFVPTLDAATADRILGVPLIENPHVASPGSAAKSLVAAHFPSYYVRSAGGLTIARSDDFAFDYDVTTIRATWRVDGNLPQATHAKVFLGGTN